MGDWVDESSRVDGASCVMAATCAVVLRLNSTARPQRGRGGLPRPRGRCPRASAVPRRLPDKLRRGATGGLPASVHRPGQARAGEPPVAHQALSGCHGLAAVLLRQSMARSKDRGTRRRAGRPSHHPGPSFGCNQRPRCGHRGIARPCRGRGGLAWRSARRGGGGADGGAGFVSVTAVDPDRPTLRRAPADADDNPAGRN